MLIVSWASLQKQFILITGDLNLDRFKPEEREGKILRDLEEIHGLTCLIEKPTRVTENSQTLIDVIITNRPELFNKSDVYNTGISDHAMVYGVMNEKAIHYSTKVISCRNFKNVNEGKLLQNLSFSPWHVGEIFESIDDQYFYWNLLVDDVLQEHVPLR